MEEKIPGYCTITYRLRLYTDHMDYLKLTKEVYNEIILKYYNLLLDNIELLNLSNQYCLRELEKLTSVSLSKDEKDIPAYFRRAGINNAIGSARSYIALLKNFKEDSLKEKSKEESKTSKARNNANNQVAEKITNKNSIKKEPSRAVSFNASPVYYKGMYRNLDENNVELKLWNGEKWEWYRASIKGKKFDKEEALSPTIVIDSKFAMLHVPVKKVVEDVTPVKQRMNKENVKVLALSFSNYDNFAICVVLDKAGNFVSSKFIGGGKEYKDRTSKILAKIKKDRQTNKKLAERDHKNYWIKLNNISTTTAHKVSKEIVDFAKENDVQVISIAEQVEANEFITKKVGRYSPIYLRHKVISLLEYKAFKEGILITRVRSNYTANRCYKCRGKIKRLGKQEAICENNHRSNYYFNTAINVGLMALKKFGNIWNPT